MSLGKLSSLVTHFPHSEMGRIKSLLPELWGVVSMLLCFQDQKRGGAKWILCCCFYYSWNIWLLILVTNFLWTNQHSWSDWCTAASATQNTTECFRNFYYQRRFFVLRCGNASSGESDCTGPSLPSLFALLLLVNHDSSSPWPHTQSSPRTENVNIDGNTNSPISLFNRQFVYNNKSQLFKNTVKIQHNFL